MYFGYWVSTWQLSFVRLYSIVKVDRKKLYLVTVLFEEEIKSKKISVFISLGEYFVTNTMKVFNGLFCDPFC
jgi:hypothetical protein